MVSYEIKRPFLVLATQNPVERGEGTYNLPAAQLDRFMVKMSMGYPPPESEKMLILEQAAPDPLERLKSVTDQTEVKRALADVRLVKASEAVAEYLVQILLASRADERLTAGASPRSGISVMRLAKAYALSFGRNEVTVEDIRAVAAPSLAHRFIPKDDTDIPTREIVAEYLKQLPAPAEHRAR
jgi:MoxR-like ATPase